MLSMMVTQRELKAGDQVTIGHGPYTTATVTKVVDGLVHLVRPYVHIDEQTGIDYIGVENWTMFQDSPRTIERFEGR